MPPIFTKNDNKWNVYVCGRLGWPSVTEVLLLAVTVVLYREKVVRRRLRLTY